MTFIHIFLQHADASCKQWEYWETGKWLNGC